MPSSQKLVSSEYYKSGLIYGLDVSSGVAVHALEIQPTDHVLDICCAPGAKLLYISDFLRQHIPESEYPRGLIHAKAGTVTGVDIAKHRLSSCRNLLKKYKVMMARLFCEDATGFSVPAPDLGFLLPENREKRKREAESDTATSTTPLKPIDVPKAFWADRLVRQVTVPTTDKDSAEFQRYDKVIVDAECTHDGSIMHVLKYCLNGNLFGGVDNDDNNNEEGDGDEEDVVEGEDNDNDNETAKTQKGQRSKKQWTWSEFEQSFLGQDRLNNLESLQKRLLMNGYSLLKPGGILVYSTCSFSRRQNEEVVAWLLRTVGKENCVIEPIPGVDAMPVGKNFAHMYDDVDLRNVVRFSPRESGTSGLFVARMRKKGY